MKATLFLTSALAALTLANPTAQVHDPPDKPNGCDKCDKHSEACRRSWWCFFYPQECDTHCQIDTWVHVPAGWLCCKVLTIMQVPLRELPREVRLESVLDWPLMGMPLLPGGSRWLFMGCHNGYRISVLDISDEMPAAAEEHGLYMDSVK